MMDAYTGYKLPKSTFFEYSFPPESLISNGENLTPLCKEQAIAIRAIIFSAPKPNFLVNTVTASLFVSIRPTTGIKPLYTTIATVTINSISRYCFVEPICYSLYQLQDSSFCLVSTHSGCFNFHLCGSRFKSSSWVAFL